VVLPGVTQCAARAYILGYAGPTVIFIESKLLEFRKISYLSLCPCSACIVSAELLILCGCMVSRLRLQVPLGRNARSVLYTGLL
jgi:hypothetical protein